MSCATPSTGFAYASPHEASEALLCLLDFVDQERIALAESAGRVLSQAIHADRDSPPSDVSAMDGYAVCSKEVAPLATLQLHGEIAIGQPAPSMLAEGCYKIGTGACVPEDCGGIIPREQVDEAETAITLHDGLVFKPGQHIRRQGENTPKGSLITSPGTMITPPVASALAAFGQAEVSVYTRLRISVLTTGDELQPVASDPKPWQIRDSNGSTLSNALASVPWVETAHVRHVTDNLDALADALQASAEDTDLIVTTGGVSMGDHDYLKPALLQAEGKIVYHKLPIRPGKPSLGGVLPKSKTNRLVPIIALPGNPVAVAVGIPLFISAVARKLAGINQPRVHRPKVELTTPSNKPFHLWRYLPVRWVDQGRVELIPTMGSGDLASAALAEGYVEIPPDAQGIGPWVFYDAKL